MFAFSFMGSGSGELSAIAVNQSNGLVYVADRANNRVEVFEPERASPGAPVGERFVSSFSVPYPTSVAVDGSSDPSDASRGDIYVVGSTEHEVKEEEPGKRVYESAPEGKEVLLIRKYKEPVEKGEEPEEAEELGEVKGLAVDPAGHLYVYQPGVVDIYTDAAKNKGLASVAAPPRATTGLGLDSEGDLYLGHESSNPESEGQDGATPVVGKFEAELGTELIGELDQQPTSAVTVNTSDDAPNQVDEQNDVYVTNVGATDSEPVSSVAEFSPAGELIQRFSTQGLRQASGVAVEDASGAVFVADEGSDDVDVFALEASGKPSVEALHAQILTPTEGESDAVKLQAEADPEGSPTSSYFQYGATSCAENPRGVQRCAGNAGRRQLQRPEPGHSN